jgi:hypothetical protein
MLELNVGFDELLLVSRSLAPGHHRWRHGTKSVLNPVRGLARNLLAGIIVFCI